MRILDNHRLRKGFPGRSLFFSPLLSEPRLQGRSDPGPESFGAGAIWDHGPMGPEGRGATGLWGRSDVAPVEGANHVIGVTRVGGLFRAQLQALPATPFVCAQASSVCFNGPFVGFARQ
jgi:hypothetical protein